jgi:hypothetical protein
MMPRRLGSAFLIQLAALLFVATPSSSATAPSLGAAANVAVLAGTAVTCTNATVTGNVAVSPGTAITQTSCVVSGTINAGNALAAQAHDAFLLSYNQVKALPCDRTLTTLDSQRLLPGVYCFDAAATSTGGVLTLDGPANGIWIFKIGTLGTGALTGTGFSVVTPTGFPACNSVYWWVAEAATMTDSKFTGTILAGAAVTLTRGTFSGNAFAKAGVTITGTAVTGCAAAGGPGVPPSTCKDGDCKCKCKERVAKHHKKHTHNPDCDDDDENDKYDRHDDKNEEHRR